MKRVSQLNAVTAVSSAGQDSLNDVSEFKLASGVTARTDLLASKVTTFRIGGRLEFFFEPNSLAELCCALKWIKDSGKKLNILGFGSNLLADSEGVSGWTVHLGRSFKTIEKLAGNIFRVTAGYSLTSLARELSQAGFSGLEFAAGIPASIGGAVRMNAGAHKGEISSVLTAVEVVNEEGMNIRLNAAEMKFAYRSCSLPEGLVVTAVELKLIPASADKIMQKLTENLDYRKKTQPLSQPSAGSVFRNPGASAEMSAGAVIERLGLKGRKQAGAEISNLHANWIVNPSKTACSSDVVALIELCKSEALKQFSQDLQTEIVMW